MSWKRRTAEDRDRAYRRRVLHILTTLQRNQEIIMANADALTAAVAANTEATTKAVTEIQAAVSAPDVQPAIDAATSQVDANTAALNSAATPPA